MALIVGMDLGNSNACCYNGEEKFIFSSTYAEGVDKLDLGYQVLYQGKKFLIGDTTIDYDYETDKERESKRIMMYTLLHLACKNNDHVVIVTNCPVNDYLNKAKRISFKKFLSEKSMVSLTVGLVTKTIFIDEVMVVPEGMGTVYRYPDFFKDRVVALSDLDGGEVNNAIYDRLNIVRKQSFTEPNGIRFFERKIRDWFMKKGKKITDLEVKQIVNDPGDYSYDIDRHKTEYLDKLQSDLKSYNWSGMLPHFFTGGGVMTLGDKIEQKIPNSTISTDPLFDNCVGNYQIGVLMWESKKEKQKC